MATAQGLTVSLCGTAPAATAAAAAPAVRRRWPLALLTPPVAFIAMVALLSEHPDAAEVVVEFALIAVPALATLAAMRLSRRGWPAIVAALMAAALIWSDDIVGQVATLALLVLSCVAIGSPVPALGPPPAVAAGGVALGLAGVVLLVPGPGGAAAGGAESRPYPPGPAVGQGRLRTVHLGYGDLL